jgi:two-component system chemotaxis response regulator CheY
MALDRSMRILIVDDYATMLRILRNLLRQLGFENVDDAKDGHEAAQMAARVQYDLIISDWNMEPMTGYELLRHVRADPQNAQVPFIMITAESATENVIAAKRAGVNNYIIKPFTTEVLFAKMQAVFEKQMAG